MDARQEHSPEHEAIAEALFVHQQPIAEWSARIRWRAIRHQNHSRSMAIVTNFLKQADVALKAVEHVRQQKTATGEANG